MHVLLLREEGNESEWSVKGLLNVSPFFVSVNHGKWDVDDPRFAVDSDIITSWENRTSMHPQDKVDYILGLRGGDADLLYAGCTERAMEQLPMPTAVNDKTGSPLPLRQLRGSSLPLPEDPTDIEIAAKVACEQKAHANKSIMSEIAAWRGRFSNLRGKLLNKGFMIPRDEDDILQACEDLGAAIAKGKEKAKEAALFVEKEAVRQQKLAVKKQRKPVEKIVYIEKEKRVEIRNTKEEERLNEEITSLKRRLRLQTEATSRLETKVSEKDSEIKKLHEDRAKLDNDLVQYNIDRGQLQVYKKMFDKDSGVKETRSALSISRTP